MNINIIKSKIIELKNHKLKVKVYIGRNKYEYFEGYIDKIHPNLFTVMTNVGIKSFTYSDVLTKVVILSKFS